MARLQLSEPELRLLRASLSSALEGCIPNWELEALLGCTRSGLKRSLDAGLRRLEHRGERPGDATCERMVLLLNAVLGASQGQATAELEDLVARLARPERSPLQSGVSLRGDVTLPSRAKAVRRL